MLRAGLTLGSLLERAAALHGSSVMVDQAAEPRTGVPARILTVAGTELSICNQRTRPNVDQLGRCGYG